MNTISIVISAYNEEQNLKTGSMEKLYKYLKDKKTNFELVIVNDGSSDNTLQLLNSLSRNRKEIKIINITHSGKAAGIVQGVMNSKGDYILFTDLDQATPITELPKLMSKVNTGFDIAIGSRSDRKGAPLSRQILAIGMVIVRTLILNLSIKDTQCGFKLFTKESAKNIFTKLQSIYPIKNITGPAVNAGFDIEILYLAKKNGYKVVEVPVVWQYKESRRVNFIKDTFRSLRELLSIRMRY